VKNMPDESVRKAKWSPVPNDKKPFEPDAGLTATKITYISTPSDSTAKSSGPLDYGKRQVPDPWVKRHQSES
jgi:hypothetical protein